jgi:hypothetical protein
MRIRIPGRRSQVWFVLFLLISACRPRTDQIAVEPPLTYPLSTPLIGYGVINASYTLLMDKPEQGGVSLGYLRRGAPVKVIERRSVSGHDSMESWVLVEGNEENPVEGWIRENVADIYENEFKAKTASELMSR